MGYTHYWERKPVLPARKFRAAAEDCDRVYGHLRCKEGLQVQWEDDEFLPPAFLNNLIRFNGVGEDEGGETFLIDRVAEREPSQRPRPHNFIGGWCKTRRAPYDRLVCACLVILKHHFDDDFRVWSDGDDQEENWPAAREVCQEVLGYGKDFSLTTPDRLGPKGLWFSKPTVHPTYDRLWELENGWWVQQTTTPAHGRGFGRRATTPVTYIHASSWPHSSSGHIRMLYRCGIREAAWEATKLYLRQLIEKGLDPLGAALLQAAMQATRGDWASWHVLADQREECGSTLLRTILPKPVLLGA